MFDPINTYLKDFWEYVVYYCVAGFVIFYVALPLIGRCCQELIIVISKRFWNFVKNIFVPQKAEKYRV
jgi:hypothetical protein